MYKGYKIRLYPTKEQEELFWKHIHASRFIYNYMLEVQKDNYIVNKKYLSRYDMYRKLTDIRRKFVWLSEVSLSTLRGACNDLDIAYKMFFNKIGKFPQFKSKKRCKNIFFTRPDRFYVLDNNIHIESIGMVNYRYDKSLPNGIYVIKASDTRISVDVFGRWFITFKLECDKQAQDLNDFSVGIDLGIKELAVVSYDNKIEYFHNINKSKKMRDLEKRRKHYQRVMSRRIKKGSKNQSKRYIKVKNKVAKLYAKQSNIRNNYIHQITRYLVNKKPKRVVMEDLRITVIAKNKYLTKSIYEQKFYEFIRQMKYKCERVGIEFIQADRFYPSSKTCSCCGNVKKDLKLSDRIYKCEKCGLIIDRDENAAKNLEKYIA